MWGQKEGRCSSARSGTRQESGSSIIRLMIRSTDGTTNGEEERCPNLQPGVKNEISNPGPFIT
jgi:hypothetical protein